MMLIIYDLRGFKLLCALRVPMVKKTSQLRKYFAKKTPPVTEKTLALHTIY